MRTAVALLLLGVVAVSAYSELEYQTLFTRWIQANDKTYAHEQFFGKYNTFKANLDWINMNNNMNFSYSVGMNKFGDLNTAEFGAQFCGFKPALRNVVEVPETGANPDSIDWTTKGAVTPVKDQGQCGSCWAFSATGGIEGAVQIATGVLTSVSEQELVDCAGAQGNQGCNGGLMDYAFQYAIKNKGLAKEADYAYTARDGSCQAAGKTHVSPIKSFVDVATTEIALENASAARPVSIAIEADQSCFQFYTKGILNDKSCGTNLDHGVLLVGYGTEGTTKYWRVKNSWGTSWGDKGFIRFVKGTDQAKTGGQCGLQLAASYPVA